MPSVRTTPEAPDLQALLAVMRERGTTAVAMEVSSHALALGRVDGVRFDVAGFTNLSQDHLDFHASMAGVRGGQGVAVHPRARPHRRSSTSTTPPAGGSSAATAIPVVTFGEDADWSAREVDLRPDGSRFRLRGPGVDVRASVRLPGAFNIANAARGARLPRDRRRRRSRRRCAGVADCPGVPGPHGAGRRRPAVPRARRLRPHARRRVARCVAAARGLTRGRVVVVLGCGGDRDRAKRPLMGARGGARPTSRS